MAIDLHTVQESGLTLTETMGLSTLCDFICFAEKDPQAKEIIDAFGERDDLGVYMWLLIHTYKETESLEHMVDHLKGVAQLRTNTVVCQSISNIFEGSLLQWRKDEKEKDHKTSV